MAIKYERLEITVTGANGAATGTTKSRPIMGRLLGVHIDYTSQPITADVTVATAGAGVPALTLLAVANNATDGWYFPRVAIHTTAGAAQTIYDPAPVSDAIVASVAEGNAGSVVVTLVFEE